MYQRARLGIGYLPQEASIFRGLNVEDNIRAVLEVVEPSKKKREQELDKLLDEFNITRLRKTPSIALSGGERRRTEIARALATRPAYMLLDEPFAGIDPIAVGDIQQLVRHLTERGIGVLITDHNVRETLGLTDRAYIIYSGEVLREGRADDIINDPEVRRLYLGERVQDVAVLWYRRGFVNTTGNSYSARVYSEASKRISKNRTNIATQHGAHAKTRIPAEPGARDDAAADAGHQAAAALQSRSVGLCGRRARAQSAAGAHRARARARRASRARRRPAAARRGAGSRMAEGRRERLRGDRGLLRHRHRERVSGRRRGAARPAPSEPAAYSEWAGVGSGGREDGDYNLEAFVSAETTLADHLAEQLSLAIADPVRRMIGQHLIDLVDEAGYLTGDLAAVAEKLGAPLAEIEAVLASCRASIRPASARAT